MSSPSGPVPMTAADQLLHRSEGDPRRRSSLLSIELLASAPDWDRVLEGFERASRVIPRLRQRVVIPTAPTTAPRWVIDADFDLRYHMRRVRLPGAGTLRELLDFAEQVYMTPLELSRPLWRVTLVEGLEGGTAALLVQMSHSITDGVGAVEMFGHLYDLTPQGRTVPMPDLPVPVDLEPSDLTVQGVKDLPWRSLSLARTALGVGARAARDPLGTVVGAADYAASLRRVLGAVAEARPSPLLAGRGLQRRMLTLDVDLSMLKAAGSALGGSVNDAYLAAMCGALRRYHEAKGVSLDTLPMAIPVSLRTEKDAAGGNRWTGMTLAEPALDVLGVFSAVTSFLPDVLVDPLLESVRPADVQCSNVMSYPGPTYIGGAEIVAQYGMGPVPGVGMMTVMITRLGRAFIAVRYDTASFTDGDLLERSLQEGFDEVLGAAGLNRPLAGTRRAEKQAAVRLAPGGRPPARRSSARRAATTTKKAQ